MWGICLLAVGLAASRPLPAQQPEPNGEGAETAAMVRGEPAPVETDSVRRGPSPLGALGRSLILPGWGQVATGRPGRGAFYFAAEAASLFMVWKTQAKLNAARRASPADSALIEARVGQREDWIVLAAFFALMSGVDAWVSAHLQDFAPEVRPPPDGGEGVEVGWSVPLGARGRTTSARAGEQAAGGAQGARGRVGGADR